MTDSRNDGLKLKKLVRAAIEAAGIHVESEELQELESQAMQLLRGLARIDELEPQLSSVEPAVGFNLYQPESDD